MSLLAGVGYRVQQWGGKRDGTMGVANSCNWWCCASYYVSRALTSLQRPYEQVQCCHTENVGGKWDRMMGVTAVTKHLIVS